MAQLKRMAAYDLENVQLRVKSHKNRTLTVVEVNKVIKNNFFEYPTDMGIDTTMGLDTTYEINETRCEYV